MGASGFGDDVAVRFPKPQAVRSIRTGVIRGETEGLPDPVSPTLPPLAPRNCVEPSGAERGAVGADGGVTARAFRHTPVLSERDESRFWARVRIPPNVITGCWLWQSRGQDATSYGVFRARGTNWRSHRLAWSLMNGPIPADLMGRHSCDNPPCVNPAHILPGSAADNSRDAVERDRHVRGERSPQARLTAAQVVEIRERYAAGELTASIGGRFGIRHNHVCDIAHGVLWASAGGPITRGNERAPTEEVSR